MKFSSIFKSPMEFPVCWHMHSERRLGTDYVKVNIVGIVLSVDIGSRIVNKD